MARKHQARQSRTEALLGLFATAVQAPIERLAGLQAKIQHGADPEAIHDVRVATRRLRAGIAFLMPFLPKGRSRKASREAARLTRKLGAARNLDVAIRYFQKAAREPAGSPGSDAAKSLLAKLRARRPAAEREVRAAASRFDVGRLHAEVASLLDRAPGGGDHAQATGTEPVGPAARPPVPGPERGPGLDDLRVLAAAALTARWRRVVRRRALTIARSEPSDFHRLRIAIKKFRYTLEGLAPMFSSGHGALVERCRGWQTSLGEIHDRDVFLELVRREVEGVGGRSLATRLRQERGRLRAALLADLGGIDAAGFLREVLENLWGGLAEERGAPPGPAFRGRARA